MIGRVSGAVGNDLPPPPPDNTPFDDILDTLCSHRNERKVSVREIVDEFGGKSFGPLLALPALLEITPVGGIPGVPTFLAFLIVLIAAQVLVGRRSLWLPGFVADRTASGESLREASEKLRVPARYIDRTFHNRLERFTTAPFDRAIAAVCIVLCLSVPPLELLPFASTVPMAAIALMGLALLFDDGLLTLVGLALALLTLGVAGWLVVT